MPEAVRAVLAHAFDDLGLHRIEAYCKVENAASARVMEKVGMAFEGVLRAYVWKDGRPRDVKMYSILAPDWRNRA
jgi:ribosomal-protein-alanine N-acetyltransferase